MRVYRYRHKFYMMDTFNSTNNVQIALELNYFNKFEIHVDGSSFFYSAVDDRLKEGWQLVVVKIDKTANMMHTIAYP